MRKSDQKLVDALRRQVAEELAKAPDRVADVMSAHVLSLEVGGCQRDGVQQLAMDIMDAGVTHVCTLNGGHTLLKVRLGKDTYHALSWNKLPLARGTAASVVEAMPLSSLMLVATSMWPDESKN